MITTFNNFNCFNTSTRFYNQKNTNKNNTNFGAGLKAPNIELLEEPVKRLLAAFNRGKERIVKDGVGSATLYDGYIMGNLHDGDSFQLFFDQLTPDNIRIPDCAYMRKYIPSVPIKMDTGRTIMSGLSAELEAEVAGYVEDNKAKFVMEFINKLLS